MTFIHHNGRLLPDDQPLFTVCNRAFKYGDGLFESIVRFKGRLPFLHDHIERLHYGMQLLQLDIPENFTAAQFGRWIDELAAKNNVADNARIKITVYREEGGLYEPDNNRAGYTIEAVPHDTDRFLWNEQGLRLTLFEAIRKPVNSLGNIKTANCLVYVLAGLYRKDKGVDDCLLLNEHGRVIEAISSSLFLVKDAKLLTPSVSEGCVAGVMRKNIIQLAAVNGIEVSETKLSTTDVLAADEVFVSNAIHGIRWAAAFDTVTYKNDTAVRLTALLNSSWQKNVYKG